MRYTNNTQSPRYCARGNKLLNPACSTADFDDLAKMARSLVKDAGALTISLSKEDMSALEALFRKTRGPGAEAMALVAGAASDPRHEKAVYEQNERRYIERQKAVSAVKKAHAEREARINAESNFVLPDGTPVGREESSAVSALKAKDGTKVEPRIVDRPQSPLDILAHNAKVSTDRAQTKPLSGKAAVEAYKGVAPGMPKFPGIERQMDNLAAEKAMSDAQKAGANVFLSSDMIASGERSNYGRKP